LVKKFFLRNKKYSLEEIEHEILRKMNEPNSFCHKLRFFLSILNEAYTEAKLNQQLAAVAKVLSTIKRKHHHTAIKLKYLKYLIGLKVISRLKGLSLIFKPV
jgi:hypothetical protein